MIGVIDSAVMLVNSNQFSQPIKPYLRFGDVKNRIIAMPAYLGGEIHFAGIKWIASFPGNITKGLPRAHSVTVLNNCHTGEPVCVINSSKISGIRTAAVSGYIVKRFLAHSARRPICVGISGAGPIGRLHLKMLASIAGSHIDRFLLFDIDRSAAENCKETLGGNAVICDSWQEAFTAADIFVTCTASTERYINIPPKEGSLQLNISLRDYFPDFRKHVGMLLTDNWEEVCRENTDIELMYKAGLIAKEDVYSIFEIDKGKVFKNLDQNTVVMFNPMGMGIFDIAIGARYYSNSKQRGIGVSL